MSASLVFSENLGPEAGEISAREQQQAWGLALCLPPLGWLHSDPCATRGKGWVGWGWQDWLWRADLGGWTRGCV